MAQETAESYAIIDSGGKQLNVSPGQTVSVEKLVGEPGTIVSFDRVLLIGGAGKESVIGTPLVKGASVKAKILSTAPDRKVVVFKKRRRKGYRRRQGHRQIQTKVLIESIKA